MNKKPNTFDWAKIAVCKDIIHMQPSWSTYVAGDISWDPRIIPAL